MPKKPGIVVVGSLNVDHTLRVLRIPGPGETLPATGAFTCFGGKGANQALAAARAGGHVTMIGCVGGDDFGTAYLRHLEFEGIDTSAIVRVAGPTGSAFILVDASGENCIVVNPGANGSLSPDHIDAMAASLRGVDAVLLQLECPLPAVKRAADAARQAGARVVVNPSPWSDAFRQAEITADVLIVNEHEALALTGRNIEAALTSPVETCAEARCQALIITRGGDTTLCLTERGEVLSISPPAVIPVDTVGAGDSFAGSFTVAFCEGMPLPEAIGFANAAGALATLTHGAQPAIPTRQQILEALAR